MATADDRKRSRSFRNGLYQALEAEIREAHADANCGRLDPSRCCRTECGREDIENHGTTHHVDYNLPILWFEEMTPEDLDSYHLNCKMFASHVNESVTVNSRSASDDSGHELSMSSALAPAQGAISEETSTFRKRGMDQVGFATKLAPLKRKLSATIGADKTGSDASVFRDGTGQLSNEGVVASTRSSITSSATPEVETRKKLGQTSHPEKQESHSSTSGLEKTVLTRSMNQGDQTLVHLPCGPSTTPTAVHPTQTHETQETDSAVPLPGLPSQVQVTLQSDEDPWYNMEDDTELQHSSEYSVRGTHASDLPQLSQETAPDSCAASEHDPHVRPETEREAPSRLQSREARARLYEAFAEGIMGNMSRLDDPAREEYETRRGCAGTQESAGHRGCFVTVPITDVLPRGLPGGQNELIALLEHHLARVTKKTPNGYIARALELACHVLRQPKACVRVRPQDARNASGAGHGNALPLREAYEGYTEVLGVPEIVWEIIRTSSTQVAQLDSQKYR